MALINVVICSVIIHIYYVFGVSGSSIWDLITNRLESEDGSVSNNKFPVTKFDISDSPATQIIEKYGYPVEVHEIATEDGYLLTIHRIPNPGKPPVLFCHGMIMSSGTWLYQGPKKDLALIMHDNGYDIWLMNFRGNVYSRKHEFLDPDRDKEFWNYSFHEMGYFDLPATIDHILDVTTEKSLIYIGHSMGGTVFFVLCTTRPKYNNKIRLYHGFASGVFLGNQYHAFTNILVASSRNIANFFPKQKVYELFPSKEILRRLGTALCHKSAPTQPLCLAGLFFIVGVDYQQTNTTLLPSLLNHSPAGASLNTFIHVMQNIIDGKFRQMDYGETENKIRYKSENPPIYNLKKVTVPAILYCADGDTIVTGDHTKILATKLLNIIKLFRIPFPFFNHLDYLTAVDAKTLLYNKVLSFTNKYS